MDSTPASLSLALPGAVGLSTRPNVGEVEERRWSEMFPELLESISNRLSLQDYLVFCCVCKHWRFAPSYRSKIVHFPINQLWFMFYGFDKNELDKCYFYTLAHPKGCEVRLPQLQEATCVMSKSGWLLAKRNKLFFFCNPFSGTKIDLPEYPLQMEAVVEQVCTFSYVPTSPNCTTFIMSRWNDIKITISSCSVGGREWVTKVFHVSAVALGTMTLATSFVYSLPRDNSKDDIIFIWGSSKKAVIYYVAKNKCFLVQPNFDMSRLQFPESWESRHHADWLDKFGGCGISICPYQHISDTHMAASYYDYEALLEGRIATRVKAVWTYPLFDRVKIEASQKPDQEGELKNQEAKRRCLMVNFKQ